jgi:hypothetical protein
LFKDRLFIKRGSRLSRDGSENLGHLADHVFSHHMFQAFFTEMKMPRKASNRRVWTAAHVRELKSLARRKTPAARIARTLKRTEGATRQKAFSLGLSLDSRA